MENSFCKLSSTIQNHCSRSQSIGNLMKQYANEADLLSKPQKLTNSSFKLQYGTIITHLLLFYTESGRNCAKTYSFLEYTPEKCFNNFVQSAVEARRQCDENPNSSEVTETMKLLANSSYG